MAKIFNGMIPFASAIQPTGAQPLDDRVVVATMADLTDASTFGDAKYNGMLVAVVETQQVYMLVDDVNSTNSNSWVQVGTDFTEDISDIDSRIDTLEYINENMVSKRLSITNNSGLTTNSDGGLTVKIAPNTDNFTNGVVIDESGLKVSTYDLQPVEGNALQYKFIVDGETKTTINIPKDQFLKDASFHATAEDGVVVEAPYLKFVWDLDINEDLEGIQNVTYVPVKDLVDTYTAGDYITISNNVVSVDINSLTDQIKSNISYDTITSNLETLTTTVGDSNSGLVADVAKNTSDISSINSVLTPLSETVEEHSTTIGQHTDSIKNIAGNIVTIMTGALTHVDDTASHGIKLEYSDKELEGDWTAKAVKVSVDLEALREDLSVNADAVLTTADIKDKDSDEEARYAQGTSVQSIITNLNTRINEIDSDIQSALDGGVGSIGQGNGIEVDSTETTKPVVSVKIVEGSALKADLNGLDIY